MVTLQKFFLFHIILRAMDRDLQITEAFEHSFMQRIDNDKTREASCQVKLLTRRHRINMNQIVVTLDNIFRYFKLLHI